eukprot:EG_transcript_4419
MVLESRDSTFSSSPACGIRPSSFIQFRKQKENAAKRREAGNERTSLPTTTKFGIATTLVHLHQNAERADCLLTSEASKPTPNVNVTVSKAKVSSPTHHVPKASAAEGECLRLTEFLSSNSRVEAGVESSSYLFLKEFVKSDDSILHRQAPSPQRHMSTLPNHRKSIELESKDSNAGGLMQSPIAGAASRAVLSSPPPPSPLPQHGHSRVDCRPSAPPSLPSGTKESYERRETLIAKTYQQKTPELEQFVRNLQQVAKEIHVPMGIPQVYETAGASTSAHEKVLMEQVSKGDSVHRPPAATGTPDVNLGTAPPPRPGESEAPHATVPRVAPSPALAEPQIATADAVPAGGSGGTVALVEAVPPKRRFNFTPTAAPRPTKRQCVDEATALSTNNLLARRMLVMPDEFDLCPVTKVMVQSCCFCGIPEDSKFTLLCDSCSRAFHTFCLDPPLDYPPEGDWQCPACCEAQAPIFVRDPYMFFYPQLCHPGSTNMCDVSLMDKIMRWLLRHRSATKWDLLPPFVFHDKDQADLAPTLAAHLCGGRRRFSGADRVALLLEYAPWVEGAWGHKMLVVFDKAGNDIQYYDSLGSSSFSGDPEHVFAVSLSMVQHFAKALQTPEVRSCTGITVQDVTSVLHGHLQHRCEYVCQSWMLLIFDALISRACTAMDFQRLSEMPGIAYEPRLIPGTQLKESVVFRSAAQLIVLYHSFHLRRLLILRKDGAPKDPFGLPWGALTKATFPELLGASRKSINR